MSDTQAEQHVNGTAPAPTPAGDAPCENCATPMEKVLAVLTVAFAGFLVIMAIDMFRGGQLTGTIAAKVQEATSE